MHLSYLFLDCRHDAAFGQVNCRDRNPKFLGHVGATVAIDSGAPKGLPRGRLKPRPHLVGRPREQLALAFLLPKFGGVGRRSGDFAEAIERRHVARAAFAPFRAGHQVAQPIAHQREQPGAKRTEFRIERAALERPAHAAEHVLRQVGGVSVLQTLTAREPIDRRRVQIDEPRPGLAVAGIAQSRQQADMRRRRVGNYE